MEQRRTICWSRIRDAGLHAGDRDQLEQRIAEVLESWRNTPYMRGQCCKGTGVDCVRFVAGVLNDLFGYERVVPLRLPQDVHLHSKNRAFEGMLHMRKQFRACPVRDLVFEPGDIVILSSTTSCGGPGHAMIVGAHPNELWHATSIGVQQTGLAAMQNAGCRIVRVYRVKDRKEWLHAGR